LRQLDQFSIFELAPDGSPGAYVDLQDIVDEEKKLFARGVVFNKNKDLGSNERTKSLTLTKTTLICLSLRVCSHQLDDIDRSHLSLKAVQLTHIDEWSIDASNQNAPSLWIHTCYAWYRLVRPTEAYKPHFEPLNFKLELYRKIVELLDVSKSASKKRYEVVRGCLIDAGISEAKLMQEAEFILKHMSLLHPTLAKEDFIKTLVC